MSNTVLEVENLRKSYRQTTVIQDVCLSLERGHICGLIGPNGAGKTTIIRILAGISHADSGTVRFFGSDNLDCQRERMSFMIEAPMIDYRMTAKQNLQYVRYVRGVADKKRIDEVLNLVSLENTGSKTAGHFSLGMKQRLGIAMALMSSPEILVLDEPINGLDPEGIVDIRLMLKRLAEKQGVSILISSHILSELAELCTDFIIISHGRIVEGLSAEKLTIKCRDHITVKTTDTDKTVFVLENSLGIQNYKVLPTGEIYIYENLNGIEKISKAITGSGLILTKLTTEGKSLEDYYMSKGSDH